MIFVTGNEGKAREVRKILGDFERRDYDYTEIQSDSLEEIAAYGAQECYREFGQACFVDDSGLFVEALNGFPGPYSSYVYSTIGNQGLLRALEGIDERAAEFRCVVAYYDGDIHTFNGYVGGVISRKERGEGGFGFDPVFEVDGRTFAEIPMEEKNNLSHRRRAFENFRDWLE